MLKKLLTLSLVFVGILALSACNPTEDGPTDLEQLAEALLEVDLPATASSDLTFPSTGLHDVVITWESDNTDVIGNDGSVMIPLFTEGNKTVEITASLTLGGETLTKTFDVTVNAATTKTDMEKAEEAKAVLLIAETIVIADMTLVDTALEAAITWATSDAAYITAAGVVVRPTSTVGNVDVTLTATLTVGTASVTKDFVVTVQAEEPADVYTSIMTMHATALLNDYIEFTGIVTGIFDGGYFLSDGTYALGVYGGGAAIEVAIGDSVKVKGFYAVYNTLYQLSSLVSQEKLSSGNANPLTAVVKTIAEMLALDTSVAEMHGMYYTITGTIELRGDYDNVYLVEGDDAILIYYYSLETSLDELVLQVGKEVTITVFYYTNHGSNGPMVAFDGGADDIVEVELTDVEALEADVAALDSMVDDVTLSTIVLPATGPNATVYTAWTSSDVAVLTNDGTFVAVAATSVTITFTGTATRGTETETVTVDVVVPLNSTVQQVLDMEEGSFFQVTGTIYEVSYYGFFIEEAGNYVFVYGKDLATAAVVGDEITLLGGRGGYSGLAQINAKSAITINSSGNAVPTAVNSTVGALENDLVPRGTTAIITGMISLEGDYDNVFITDIAGGKVGIYYRSNADEIASVDDSDVQHGFFGQIVTIEVVTYQDGSVLFQGLAADVTVATYTDAYKAQAAVDALNFVTLLESDATLPADNTDAAATFVWTTSDAAVITAAGVITRVAGSTPMATLTVVATVGSETATRDIVVTLVDANDSVPMNVSDALLLTDGDNVLVTGIVTGMYYDERVIQDIVTGVGIYVDENIGGEIGDIITVRGVLATSTSNNNNRREIEDHTFYEVVSSGNALIVDAVTDVAVIADAFADMKVYTTTLTFVEEDTNGYLFFTGSGTKELKFSTFYASYFSDVYTAGDTVLATFTVMDVHYDDTRVVNVMLPVLTEAQMMMAAKGAIDVPAMTTDDLTLPAAFVDFGATITWASNNAAVLSAAGVAVRPLEGAADVDVTLTATVTVGTTVETVDFVVTVKAIPVPVTESLFFSEYAEADGGNCKYVEIYNGTDATVDLTEYSVTKGGNGKLFSVSTDNVTLSGTLAAGAVLVLGNAGCVNPTDAAQTATVPFPLVGITWEVTTVVGYINGDDALGLFHNGTLIDVIGENGTDPGTHWMVGNGNITDGETRNVLLRRIGSVILGETDWAVAAQQWIVVADDRDYSDVGTHTVD